MALNPSIILQGQTADIVGALDRGAQAGQRQNQIAKQNALAGLYAAQGDQIIAGDKGALNALARLDPNAALGVQGDRLGMDATRLGMDATRLGMERTQQAMQQAKADGQREAQEYAQRMSAAEAQAASQKVESVLQGAYMAQDEGSYNAFLTQNGIDPAQYPFAQKDMHLAKLSGAAEVLKMRASQEPKPADEYGRYASEEAAAGRQPLSRIDFHKAKQKTTRTEVGADGSVRIVEGFGESNAPPKLTVDAAKNSGFLIRTQDANEVLNALEKEGTSFLQANASKLPFDLGNYLVSENYQKFDQAKRDFVNAILRRESGAVIADSEFANAEKQYFPVPGDGPEVIAQKRKNRENAIAGLRVGSGDGGAYVDQQRASEKQATADPIDFSTMSDDELNAWIAENSK